MRAHDNGNRWAFRAVRMMENSHSASGFLGNRDRETGKMMFRLGKKKKELSVESNILG